MSFVHTFGNLNHINVRSLFSTSYTGNFGTDIIEACADMEIEHCILIAKRDKNLNYPKYITALLKDFKIPMAVFIDNGSLSFSLQTTFENTASVQLCNVVVLYRGGYDDESVLTFCQEFLTGDCKISILAATRYYDDSVFAKLQSRDQIEIIHIYPPDSNQLSTRSLKIELKSEWEPMVLERLTMLGAKDICVVGHSTIEADQGVAGFLDGAATCSYILIKKENVH